MEFFLLLWGVQGVYLCRRSGDFSCLKPSDVIIIEVKRESPDSISDVNNLPGAR